MLILVFFALIAVMPFVFLILAIHSDKKAVDARLAEEISESVEAQRRANEIRRHIAAMTAEVDRLCRVCEERREMIEEDRARIRQLEAPPCA